MCSLLAFFILLLPSLVKCQGPTPPGSFPHEYPDMPKGDYSPAWQKYFEVAEPLPNVTFPLNNNWAGNIRVNRDGHPNDTLFFWGFEKEKGSLTAAAHERSDEPWAIWLNGGPGASSLLGFMLENGPIHVTNTYSIVKSNTSWHQLADYFWIDQPVGTGYSTTDSDGYGQTLSFIPHPTPFIRFVVVADEDQMGEDFFGFVSNLVKIFPSLANRPLYLTGESYAGTYIPYITKTYFGLEKPPVKLERIAIGDGAIGSFQEFALLPMLSVLETYPQLISYDPDVYNYFKEQTHLCGYDLNLTYPQHGHFPSLRDPGDIGSSVVPAQARSVSRSKELLRNAILAIDSDSDGQFIHKRELEVREEKRQLWKRDLSGRPNGTIDPSYGCYLIYEVEDYAMNYSAPWNISLGFDFYDVPNALNPEAPADPSIFLNDNRTRAALHAPTSKNWALQINYPFGSSFESAPGSNEYGDPSVEPMAFLSELATNTTKHGIKVIIYSGNDDLLVAHRSSEVIIQNTTFGGIQGFTKRPSTVFNDDSGKFAGIVHQERGWTYALVDKAGHEVPEFNPPAGFVLAREFIFGTNPLGTVIGGVVVGGEDPQFESGIIPGIDEIYYGPGTTVSTFVYPTATIAAWSKFIATATATTAAPTSTRH